MSIHLISLVLTSLILLTTFPALSDDQTKLPPQGFDPNQYLDTLTTQKSCDSDATQATQTEDYCTDFFGYMCQNKKDKLIKDLEGRAQAAKTAFLEQAEQSFSARHRELSELLKDSPDFLCLRAAPAVDSECSRAMRKALTAIAGNRLLANILTEPFQVKSSLETTDKAIDALERLQLIDALADAALGKIKDDSSVAKVEKLYSDKIRPAALRALQRSLPEGISEHTKKLVNDKLATVKFSGTNCDIQGWEGLLGDAIKPPDRSELARRRINQLLIPNAFYNPLSHSLQICNGLIINNDTLANLTFLLGHEIFHSIDPGTISIPFNVVRDQYFVDQAKKGKQLNLDRISNEDFEYITDNSFEYADKSDAVKAIMEHPMSKVLGCLRSERSIQARRFDDLIEKARALAADPESYSKVRLVARERREALEKAYRDANTAEEKQNIAVRSWPLRTFAMVEMQTEIDKSIVQSKARLEEEKTRNPLRANSFRLALRQNNPFFLFDQLGESFADFMSIEVLAEVLSEASPEMTGAEAKVAYSTMFDATCSSMLNVRVYGDPHPIPKDRINRLLLAHPTVRKQLGCPALASGSGLTYCGGSQP